MPHKTNIPSDYQKVADAFNASADMAGYEKLETKIVINRFKDMKKKWAIYARNPDVPNTTGTTLTSHHHRLIQLFADLIGKVIFAS